VEGAIERVLGVVALADTANKMVGSFSSGMRQRLLIARALLGRPDVLLLDEPTRSLDPVSARDFRVFLRETIVREQGCTVLLATHDADDVWTLCDRVAVLHRGDVLAVDRTGDLRARVGDDVYSSWIRRSDVNRHAKIAPNLGVAVVSQGETPEQEWIEIVVEIERGTDGAANYLARLASEGIAIARLEKRAPDLAELIERVVRARGAAA
jgi:ABC-type multidrug transport system ATPase subunit